jgi:hypothetical protein
MNTACIVVLTIAIGDDGIAAYPAEGSGNTLPPTASSNVVRDGVSDPTTIQK